MQLTHWKVMLVSPDTDRLANTNIYFVPDIGMRMKPSEAESSDKSLVIVLSVLAMMTALQTTVIFLAVLVVVCKYNKRKAYPDTTKPVAKMDDQLYEIMDCGGKGQNDTCEL